MHIIYNEEEVPNMKCMRVVEEVSLPQSKTAAVPLDKEEVPVPQALLLQYHRRMRRS
jgi:hypothetical protein